MRGKLSQTESRHKRLLQFKRSFEKEPRVTLQAKVLGSFTAGLRNFAAQVSVSIAATICATALYGHFARERASVEPERAAISAGRVEGGTIPMQTLPYYPEHLAALESLSRFQPVSAQRTAELARKSSTRWCRSQRTG